MILTVPGILLVAADYFPQNPFLPELKRFLFFCVLQLMLCFGILYCIKKGFNGIRGLVVIFATLFLMCFALVNNYLPAEKSEEIDRGVLLVTNVVIVLFYSSVLVLIFKLRAINSKGDTR